MKRTRARMTNGKKKVESDSDSGGEEISLISWLNLYQGFISDAADLLKDEISNIKQRKIVRNESTLKNEKKPETVILSQNIVTSFNIAISKAVKDLQGYGAQMTEGLTARFKLGEDWKQSTSSTVSVAGSEDAESDSSRKTCIVPTKRDQSLQTKSVGDDEARNTVEKKPAIKSTRRIKEELDAMSDRDFISASSSDSEPTVAKRKQIKSPRKRESEVSTENNNDASGETSKSLHAANEEPSLDKSPRNREIEASTDNNNDSSEETSKSQNVASGEPSLDKSPRKPEIEASIENNNDSSEETAKSQHAASREPSLDKSPRKPESDTSIENNNDSSEETAKSQHAASREPSLDGSPHNPESGTSIENNNDSSEETSKSQNAASGEPSLDKSPRKREIEAIIEDNNDSSEETQKSRNTASGAPSIDKSPHKSAVSEGEESDASIATCIVPTNKGQSSQTKSVGDDEPKKALDKKPTKKSTRRSKEELDAMRDILSASSSDSEPRVLKKKETKSPRKRESEARTENNNGLSVETSKSRRAIGKPSLDDPKLKKDASYVHLEKLPPAIEKKLEEDSYVMLNSYNKFKKISLEELVKSDKAVLSDSDSSASSDDSIKKFEKELAKLSKNSIIRTKKYTKKKKESGKISGMNSKRTRRAAKEEEIVEIGSSDSDTTCDDNKNVVKSNNNMFNSDVSASGSDEDIDADSSDESSNNKKNKQSRTNPTRNSDRNRKKYVQATITSSSDSEKQNMKDVLGSDSDSNKKKKLSRFKKVDKHDSDSDSDFLTNKKRVTRKAAKGSDSDVSLISINSDTDDDFVKPKRSSKRRRDSSSDSRKKKKKRKRIVAHDSDDSNKNASNDSDIEEISQDEASSSQKGRKNIRKIMSNKHLAKTTKEAEKEEEERRKRLVEKQKLFNGIHKAPESDKLERLILDVDPETKEPILEVDKSIVCQLKPHQAEGIKFMYNACFESVDMIKQNKVPGGCILAHCMGLGKTLQSIAFIHTLLTNPICEIKTALVICPLSTVNNWYNEFQSWAKDAADDIKIHKLYEAKNTTAARVDYLKTWQRRGGVGILHYDIFRRLADPKGKSKIKENLKNIIHETLLDPGPDIVICDEGHLLKNWKSMLSLAVNNIRTHRRVVLTGTPLQNNLVEYHTMMNFVKPNLLGSLPEFTNRFVNPIKNGQHADSTDYDVKTMKRRAHVLHRKLMDCVQRCDYSILAPYLPPKYEYIIKIKLSEKQELLYKYYLENVVDSDLVVRRRNLLKYYAELVKIWSHPMALTMRRASRDEEEVTSEEDSLQDFIADDDSSDSGSGDGNKKGKPPKKRTRATAANDPEPENAVPSLEDAFQRSSWWNAVFKSKLDIEDCSISGKLVILQEILKTSETIGDRVLVFSQYLSSLDIIEGFLEDWDKESREKDDAMTFPMSSTPLQGRWRKNIEYFRIDGQTKVQDRHRDCEKFNKKSSLSKGKLFLISTRAGGLGINLYGANRVVIFDASWNPSQDMQSIFRVYRFGQDKPCYIYRLIAQGTMEEKILRRQITKLSLSSRVVDEHQIERHFKFDDVNEMYRYDEEDPSAQDAVLAVPKDRLLADLLMSHREWIRAYEEFDSLLENKPDEGLTDDEKQLAWEEYRIESERQKQTNSSSSSAVNEAATYLKVKTRLTANHPLAAEGQIETATRMSMDVIEKIRRLMLLQHSGGMVDHQLNPLKVWLQQAVSPRDIPAPPVPPNAEILEPLPPAFYQVVGSISQYMPPRPRMNFSLLNQQGPPPPHVLQNFRNIASNTVGNMRMDFPRPPNQVNGHIRQNPY